MPRRAAAGRRPIEPDAVHNSKLVQQVVNKVMVGGKKSTAETIVYEALETLSRRTSTGPVEALETSIKALTPVLEVKSRRVGGATYQVPVEVPAPRARTLAVRWLVEFSRQRREKNMSDRLAGELVDAQSQQGAAALVRLLSQQVLDPEDVGDRQVAVIAQELLGQGRPADPRSTIHVGDITQLMLRGRLSQRGRRLRRDEDQAADRGLLSRLQGEKAAEPVTDDDRRLPEPDQARDDILDIGLERELGGIDRPRPEVVLEIEGVPLPAARGEVAEEPLPEPRAGQLTVHEQEWLAS